MKSNKKILLTGASGQVGRVLYRYLADRYGASAVIASDIKALDEFEVFEHLDITGKHDIADVLDRHDITEIYHLAAILSANAEKNPIASWEVNMSGLLNILQTATEKSIKQVFFPSSIAVFGNHANLHVTGQFEVQHPTTLYGISKSAGENWCQYYFNKYGLDVRSIRYPGIIGYSSLPGGGTTDYAVHIYHEALKEGTYTSYIAEKSVLPMIYMDDAIRATVELMEADLAGISVRTSYNLQGLSFSPAEIATEIKKHIPGFTITYEPDFRQKIADNWPGVIDDSVARKDWNWKPEYDLESMTTDMLNALKPIYSQA